MNTTARLDPITRAQPSFSHAMPSDGNAAAWIEELERNVPSGEEG